MTNNNTQQEGKRKMKTKMGQYRGVYWKRLRREQIFWFAECRPKLFCYYTFENDKPTGDEFRTLTEMRNWIDSEKGEEMKPELFEPINSIEDGKRFIELLQNNDLIWHFDDCPHDCLEGRGTAEELTKLGKRRDRLYAFDWGQFECPIGYVLHITNKESK